MLDGDFIIHAETKKENIMWAVTPTPPLCKEQETSPSLTCGTITSVNTIKQETSNEKWNHIPSQTYGNSIKTESSATIPVHPDNCSSNIKQEHNEEESSVSSASVGTVCVKQEPRDEVPDNFNISIKQEQDIGDVSSHLDTYTVKIKEEKVDIETPGDSIPNLDNETTDQDNRVFQRLVKIENNLMYNFSVPGESVSTYVVAEAEAGQRIGGEVKVSYDVSGEHPTDDQKPFICSQCGLFFTEEQFLALHRKNVHGLHTDNGEFVNMNILRLPLTADNPYTDMKTHHGTIYGQSISNFTVLAKQLTETSDTQSKRKVDGKKRVLNCKLCNKTYSNTGNLNIHMRTHTEPRPFKCNMCDGAFAQAATLTVHMRKHTGEKPYKCQFCDLRFAQKSHLITHTRTHTGEKPYMCKICGKTFSTSCPLRVHMRTHTGEKPYTCNYCDKTFTQGGNLKEHLQIHTGDKPLKCEMCDKTFARPNNLKTHVRTHTGEKPFACNMCDRTFGQSGTLKIHMRTHTGEKPFKCDVCDKFFVAAGDLTRHIRIHTGEKPYKCEVCNKTFVQANNLKTHMSTHTGEKPYKCQVCDKTFALGNNLKVHMRTHVHTSSSTGE